MKKEIKIKLLKAVAVFICMLAAGACYSCSQDFNTQNDIIELESNYEEEIEDIHKDDVTAAQDKAVCYIHICGEVVSPGVYEAKEGSRVFQIVEQAGGFTENALSEYLNMAQIVTDGMKLVVPAKGELQDSDIYGQSELKQQENTGMINLNTASKEELMTLKGIGEARADDIIMYRKENGAFMRIEDVMNIPGIKEAAFQKIKDKITV